MSAVFADETTLRYALAFEAGLARAEAAEGLIKQSDADEIVKACESISIRPDELAAEAAFAGTLAIPLLKHLRSKLSKDVAGKLHRGATSQDVADTILACQMRDAEVLLTLDVDRILKALATLAVQHASTPAIGRTLLQDALPVGLGLRFAQWHAGLADGGRRLANDVRTYAGLQFGGAAGTRANLEGKGTSVAARLASALNLADGPPWHGRRTGIAAIATSVAIVVGALGKMARDISLLSQNAVNEVREPAVPGRGGSSVMAHKRNPTGCQIALSATYRAPGLATGILSGLVAEEERGLGGWQAEAPALADLFLVAAGSAQAMAGVAEGLEVDPAAIARNLNAADVGHDIGESATLVKALLGKQG
jgi:3-carboxy-cis,cis-muconate cycloisomerase